MDVWERILSAFAISVVLASVMARIAKQIVALALMLSSARETCRAGE